MNSGGHGAAVTRSLRFLRGRSSRCRVEVLEGRQTLSSLAGDKVTLSSGPSPHAEDSSISASAVQRYQTRVTASPYRTYKSR